TVGLLRGAPAVGGAFVPDPSDLAEQWVADLERLGARVVEREIPEPEASTWPLFDHEAALTHRATFPSRADEYGDLIREKLEQALEVDPADVERAYAAVREWRLFEPDVDLYVSPCVTVDLPGEDVPEPEVRFPISAYLRWVNMIGWAGLAIGNLQLIAPRDEVVLASGLAWERG
ncbi:MAG TPA: hypothetical protein VJ247_03225, partial [Gaiella sp.]|nr:hypothetical protein [Gaiella sp.]